MSFWGKLGGALKGIGKVALKAAPVAAAFIPGVGPLAAMGIGAATNAASKKLSGGSWGDALKSGAIGGAMGYAGGALKGSGLIGKLGSKLGIGGNGVQAGVDSVSNRILGGPSTGQKLMSGFQNVMRSRQQQNWMSPYMRRPNQPRTPYGIGPSNPNAKVGYGMGIQDPRRYGGTPNPNVIY